MLRLSRLGTLGLAPGDRDTAEDDHGHQQRDDPSALNSFAWWCYENDLNLPEAYDLALKGASLAGADAGRSLRSLQELSEGFASVAGQVKPSVVAIATEQKRRN